MTPLKPTAGLTKPMDHLDWAGHAEVDAMPMFPSADTVKLSLISLTHSKGRRIRGHWRSQTSKPRVKAIRAGIEDQAETYTHGSRYGRMLQHNRYHDVWSRRLRPRPVDRI